MSDVQPILELDAVSKEYPQPDGQPLVVLHDIGLTAQPGETLAVVGPSGSGKSTLLNLIGALDRPTAGTVRLGGRDLRELDDAGLAALRNRQIGFVFQLHHLLAQCTVLENVLLPALAGGSVTSETRERGRDLLDRVGLARRLDQRPAQLSGGECQRVAVARALINSPRLVLADEPTGSLDRATSRAVADLLVDLNRSESTTLIVVTHSRELTARMDRVLGLRDGALEPLENRE